MNTFTPNGRDVSRRVAAMSARTASGVRYPAARKPRPPAFDTAAASSGVEGPPAIGACTIGRRLVMPGTIIHGTERGRHAGAAALRHGPRGARSRHRELLGAGRRAAGGAAAGHRGHLARPASPHGSRHGPRAEAQTDPEARHGG